MRTSSDVQAALEAIGFEAEHKIDEDGTGYTRFRRGPEIMVIDTCRELVTLNAAEKLAAIARRKQA